MKTLDVTVADVTVADVTVAPPAYSLAGLRDELKAAGLGAPSALRTYTKFVLLLAAAAGALTLIATGTASVWWEQAPLAALAAWFVTAGAMCGHDGAHGATSRHAWLNTLLAQLGFTLLGGLSVTYWRHKHNALHHPNVNVAHKDPDVEQGLLSLSTRQFAEQPPFVRWLQRHFQALGFWGLGAPLVVVDLRVTSLRYVFGQLAQGRRVGEHLADLAWIVAHYVVFLLVPLLFMQWTTLLFVYGVSTVLLGVFLTFIFAPAHIPFPIVKKSSDSLLLQLSSTRNFETNWFFRLTLIGLDCQIEHHLAPKLPHHELRQAGVIVRDYCKRHGLPYHRSSWLRAIRDTNTAVRNGWQIEEVIVGAPG